MNILEHIIECIKDFFPKKESEKKIVHKEREERTLTVGADYVIAYGAKGSSLGKGGKGGIAISCVGAGGGGGSAGSYGGSH